MSKLSVTETTAADVLRFYEEALPGAGWSIDRLEDFRNEYGHRLTATRRDAERLVINIAKWPHEPFVAVSIYRYRS